MSSQALTDERAVQLLQTFKRFDKDGNSYLSPQEFMAAAKLLGKTNEEELGAMIKQVDHNGDGLLSLIEFTELMGHSKEIEDYQKFFKELDKDDSGLLSAKEIMQVLKKSNVPNPKEEVATMFQKARKRIDDELDFEEFVSLMIFGTILFPSKKPLPTGLSVDKLDELKTAFEHFDKDHSGKISFLEFRDLVGKIGKSISDTELRDMLKEADSNGDGEIGFAEFIAIMGFPEEIAVYRNAFKSIDTDHSGIVEEEELARLLKSMQIPKSKAEAKKILKRKKKLGRPEKGITFDEFVELMFRY